MITNTLSTPKNINRQNYNDDDDDGGKQTPEEEFAELFDKMYALCIKNNWGDPFNYSRAREIYMANELGHKICITFRGADGFEDKEKMTMPVEYKSTTQEKIKATYNGISCQEDWKKQIEYLKNEKICKYEHHYIARFEMGKIVEMYKMNGDKVYEHLLPKLKKSFENKGSRKDPRLGASMPTKYILENSEKII